ncbi:MAG: ABC transporter substrate-binding protein [Spirochaetaceae bacterium]|nr:ABC transporter substrate-binding protein [Spirochaetaceae bacterium]
MKRVVAGLVMVMLLPLGAAFADDVKLGVLLGYTGPIESLVGPMADGAELAIKEVSDSGALLGGLQVVSVRGDTTCIDSAAATAAAERLITADQVNAIVGGDCSGVTIAVLQNVAKPNGIVMISPSATSPALSTIEDDGLFFRTAPSDARQGEVVADILQEMDIGEAALTYTNNDYGKGLADSIEANFKMRGGTITISAPHEDGKGDYSAEVAALDAVGGDILIVAGYLDQGGKGIIQAALDSGAFDQFFLPDGMIGDSLVEAIGADLNGSIGTVPGTDSPGAARLEEIAGMASGPFVSESYDAAALILLAMQAAGSTDSGDFKDHVMAVANAPGEQIFPGELEKALGILANGGEIDYVGASAVELVGAGESAGNYRQMAVEDGALVTVRYR